VSKFPHKSRLALTKIKKWPDFAPKIYKIYCNSVYLINAFKFQLNNHENVENADHDTIVTYCSCLKIVLKFHKSKYTKLLYFWFIVQ